MNTPVIVVWSGCALLGALGLAMLLRSLFPPRRGVEPFCRRCHYNLSGLDLSEVATRCPECGRSVAETGVVIGERRRRPGRIAAGVLLIFLSLLPLAALLAARAAKVDWYVHLPTWWLMGDAAGSDDKLAGRALVELERRYRADELDDKQRQRLMEVCVGELTRKPERKANLDLAVRVLERARVAETLSETHLHEFFENVALADLSVRQETARRTTGQPIRLNFRWRPSFVTAVSFRIKCAVDSFRWNDVVTPAKMECELLPQGTFMGSRSRIQTPVPPNTAIGDIEVRATAHISIYESRDADGTPIYQFTRELSGRTRMVDSAVDTDLIRQVRSAELDASVVDTFGIRRVGWLDNPALGANARPRVIVELSSGSRLVDCAFEVVCKCEDGRTARSTALLRGGTSSTSFLELKGDRPERVTITLRADPTAALATQDVVEIWGGSLVFEDLPVARASSQPSTAPAASAVFKGVLIEPGEKSRE